MSSREVPPLRFEALNAIRLPSGAQAGSEVSMSWVTAVVVPVGQSAVDRAPTAPPPSRVARRWSMNASRWPSGDQETELQVSSRVVATTHGLAPSLSTMTTDACLASGVAFEK